MTKIVSNNLSLDLFINALISKYNDGQELYNNMNIIEFVTKLTK